MMLGNWSTSVWEDMQLDGASAVCPCIMAEARAVPRAGQEDTVCIIESSWLF